MLISGRRATTAGVVCEGESEPYRCEVSNFSFLSVSLTIINAMGQGGMSPSGTSSSEPTDATSALNLIGTAKHLPSLMPLIAHKKVRFPSRLK